VSKKDIGEGLCAASSAAESVPLIGSFLASAMNAIGTILTNLDAFD